MKHYWLASYPKSGNTWLRLFLSNMIDSQSMTTPNINDIRVGDMAGNRYWVENSLGIDIAELSDDEIDTLRSQAYQWYFENQAQDDHTTHQFHKTHDAYRLPSGQTLIPEGATSGVIYLIRNPLDIAVSGANHASISLDQAIQTLCNQKFTLSPNYTAMNPQLRQFLGDWSHHVSSWLHADVKKLVIRYEDMNQNPLPTFQLIAQFLGLPSDANRIQTALSHCQFDKIQKQENEYGFIEKSHKVTNFFRKGIVGDWVNHLNNEQIKTITDYHHAIMQQIGYLDHNGAPLISPMNTMIEIQT